MRYCCLIIINIYIRCIRFNKREILWFDNYTYRKKPTLTNKIYLVAKKKQEQKI